jgi:hypothetical protein
MALARGGRRHVHIPLPGDFCNAVHGEVAAHCVRNVNLIASGNRASFFRAGVFLLFWCGELHRKEA